MLSEKALLVCLIKSVLHPLDGKSVFTTDVDDSLACLDGVTSEDHPLDQSMRIAFQDQPVFERSGFSFISVTDNVLLRSGRCERPFLPRGEACTATATQTGLAHNLYDILRREPLFDHLCYPLIGSCSDRFVEVLWVNAPTILQDDARLSLGKADCPQFDGSFRW